MGHSLENMPVQTTIEPVRPRKKRLGEYLIEKGLITQAQVDVAVQEKVVSKEKIGEIFIRFGFVSRADVRAALAEIDPNALIGEGNAEIEVPKELLIETRTVLLGSAKNQVYVASLGRRNGGTPQQAVEELRKYVGPHIEIKLCPINYNLFMNALESLNHESVKEVNVLVEDDINLIIQHLVAKALEQSASDIHIAPDERAVHVRFRVDGVLYMAKVLPKSIENKLISRIKEMSGIDISEKMLPQDGSFTLSQDSTSLNGAVFKKKRNIDFRVATVPTGYGEKITMRILDKEKVLVELDDLGITKMNDWLDLTKVTEGIVLVCGPTGAGKTTTLYSTIKHLNSLGRAIYSIEEPIEYKIPFVTQVQVNRKIGLDFSRFIRTVLRHDPDIVIVGEIRDSETADNAFRLAETGHLVYATLHTNDLISTVMRLKDLGIETAQLEFLLRGVLVQRLVRKKCLFCGGNESGCFQCMAGYKGRTLLTEFGRFNDDDIEKLMRRNDEYHYHSFEDDVRIKLSNGITDCFEIERVMGYKQPGAWCQKCHRRCDLHMTHLSEDVQIAAGKASSN